MCRVLSGNPNGPEWACSCHLNEDDERRTKGPLLCIHGRSQSEPCEMCRVSLAKGIPLSELKPC